MLTQDEVKSLFDYRDGRLFWKIDRRAKKIKGYKAGGVNKRGYICIMINGKTYYAHRLIWLWHHGYTPEHDLDHIDRNPLNNHIDNLREISDQCNIRNTNNFNNNTSGVKGVSKHNQSNKYVSNIRINDKLIYLGIYTYFLDAVCARLAAEQAEKWEGCDLSSPAYQYVKKHIPSIK